MTPMPLERTRQGSPEVGERAETVVFHELVHSAQFTPEGQLTNLTQQYITHFGWSYSDGKWSHESSKGPFPGTTDDFFGNPVAYPEADRTGLEDMADGITYYRYEPGTLKRESPERYAWIKENVFGGQEFQD